MHPIMYKNITSIHPIMYKNINQNTGMEKGASKTKLQIHGYMVSTSDCCQTKSAKQKTSLSGGTRLMS